MSWLSTALKRNKLDVLNKIAKPVQAVVNPMLDKLPVIGSIKAGAEAVGDFIPQPNQAASQAIGGALAGKAGLPGLGAMGGGGDVSPWLKALAAAQALNAANLGRQSTEYAKNAMGDVNASYAQRAPLRSLGIAGMQAAPTKLPQLGKLGAVGNPFATSGGAGV